MFNSFGGKIEEGETSEASAKRELLEETGIDLPLEYVTDSRVGSLFFTFQDSPIEMIVHVFRVHINIRSVSSETTTSTSTSATSSHYIVDEKAIRGCDEITPHWFDDWHQIPLDNMFADDSIWLTRLLSSEIELRMDGWFHFAAGGTDTNTILHYHLDCRSKTSESKTVLRDKKHQPITLEKRLFHALHASKINSPSLKEFNEAFAFLRAFRDEEPYDVVIDVCGGHGALAALFLITNKARAAVVIDPAKVGAVQRAWADFMQDKPMRYRHECLRTGLPTELYQALQYYPRENILVVACHACQHLSEEIVQISCEIGVNVAVMPCCQKDVSPGSNWKQTSKNLQIPVQYTMDILLAGKVMSWQVGRKAGVHYDVRLKVINSKLTAQNRLIICRALACDARKGREALIAQAHSKLGQAYKRAHKNLSRQKWSHIHWRDFVSGILVGTIAAVMVMKR